MAASLFLGQSSRPVVVLDTDKAGRDRQTSLLKELYAGHDSSIVMLDGAIGRSGEEIEIEDIIGEEILVEGVSSLLGVHFEVDEQDRTAEGVVNHIQAAAKRQGINLGQGWKARVAQELVGSWAENRTTLTGDVLDTAAQLFHAINRSFYGSEEDSQQIAR